MALHLPGRLLPLPALRLSSCSGQQTDSEEVEAVTAGQGFDGLLPAELGKLRSWSKMQHLEASTASLSSSGPRVLRHNQEPLG